MIFKSEGENLGDDWMTRRGQSEESEARNENVGKSTQRIKETQIRDRIQRPIKTVEKSRLIHSWIGIRAAFGQCHE